MLCCRQAAALHANQISQLRGLFVRWHQWLLRARTPLKGAFTDPCTGSNGHPGSHQHIPASLHPAASVTFLCLSCFSAWLQSLCLLFPGSIHPFCALRLCSHKTNRHRPTGSRCHKSSFYLEEVIHYISNVEVRQNTPCGHKHTHKHTLLFCLGEQRPEPAGSHNSTEEEEYQTTGSFFC